jgi:hypothetical protein
MADENARLRKINARRRGRHPPCRRSAGHSLGSIPSGTALTN